MPRAEQGISYGMPVFRVSGKAVAGYAAFKAHCSYFPHSGSVLGELGRDVTRYTRTKSALCFAPDRPLSNALVRKLVATRLAELTAL